MPPCVGFIDVVVVVLPITRAGVVRRIDINQIDFSLVRIQKQLKSVIIVGVDQDVPWLIGAAARNAINWRQYRINRLAEANDQH